MYRILVTGANGFVGKALCQLLVKNGMIVSGAVRKIPQHKVDRVSYVTIDGIEADSDWSSALNDIDCVIHLAARVHVMHETASDPLEEFRRVNTCGTEKLARDAAGVGVKRIVYLSTIKANGEESDGAPFIEHVEHPPLDPYGRSKWEAEQRLRQVAAETGIEIVIIRPPLVYGEGVKGNFLTMLKMVEKGVPLPLGAVDNRRSLVALNNLIDLIRECIINPAAADETFLVSDGYDLSTTELLRTLARGMGKSPRLIPVPAPLLSAAATLFGKRAVARRLLGSLQVDISHAEKVLGWRPPYAATNELTRVAERFNAR